MSGAETDCAADDAAAELARCRAQLEMLTAELAETNAGVVVLYAELEDQSLQLREASELKSRFLSYMSHEFRTPLGSIRSLVRILLDEMDGPLGDEQKQQIEFIRNSAVELTEMVDDLLDLAKVEAGRVTISPEWFELVNLFSALRGMFKPLLDSGDVVLAFEEPGDVPRIFTDDRKLSQILRNFISNALKFTPKGEVRVRARRVDDGTVEFSVTDTGIGIEKDAIPTLFRDFVQVDSNLQRRYRGTGLGLSLSKRLAELLGGRVAVESSVGQGSIFSVFLPIEFQPPADGAGGAAP